MHFAFTLTRAEQEARKGEVWIGGRLEPVAGESTYGTISAIRPSTGKIAWQRRTGWLWSGALATAGGLLFVGENDGWFRAYDARTGRPLWEFFCGAGVNAPPVSFELDGEQFIAVVAAGSRYSESRGSALLVFGLGGGRAAPAVAERPATSSPAERAERAETWPPDSATRVTSRFAYSSAQRAAWIGVDADSRAMSFNAAANGAETFVVPLGWTVEIRLRNGDAAPHSARVVPAQDTIPLTIARAVFAGAESPNAEVGVASGRSKVFRFSASRAGSYLIACAVPGHAAAGMYVRLIVDGDVSTPSWRATAQR
jgi:hypothetical protein